MRKEGLLGFYRWLPAIAIMIGIFIASNTPSTQLPSFGVIDTLVKKSGHFLAYAGLACAFHFAMGNRTPRAILISIGLAFLYACSDELHQLYTAGRHSSPVDVGIDTLGAITGISLWTQLLVRRVAWLYPRGDKAAHAEQE